MNLPPIDVKMLQATMGLPAKAFPVVPVVDFGITQKPKDFNCHGSDSEEIYHPDTEFRFRCDVEAE
ncbi:MAG: hypothetical protein NC453_20445 [Muribaculum sp.]|nr:hypothetical protein [Muribaculum sp.]